MNRTAALLCAGFLTWTGVAEAATRNVPEDYATIQAAVDAAGPGDVVLVAAGTYRERIRLKPGIVVRSAGAGTKGKLGLKRAEETIIDGGRRVAGGPGVVVAEGSTLDGFTVTGIGRYDEDLWRKHYESRGEDLPDQQGAAGAAGGPPAAVSLSGETGTVSNNIVHHNGHVGIAIVGRDAARVTPLVSANVVYRNMGGGIGIANGAEPVVRENVCFQNLRAGIGCRGSSPFVLANKCYENVRAGIGCREGAGPIIRGNTCYGNRRAGIGVRMEGTAPVVEDNECYENGMAGIGTRDGAAPVIRGNRCYKNEMAGIGCRDAARPVLIGNQCRENRKAGIGIRGRSDAVVLDNQCVENRLVAVGVIEESKAHLSGNQLSRTGGVPPLVAVKDGSAATLRGNRLRGGGVAGLLVQGQVQVSGNQFTGKGKDQGSAIWVWQKSSVAVSGNQFDGYRNALNASKSEVAAWQNTVSGFDGPAFIVTDSSTPAHVFGNTALSDGPKGEIVRVRGATGIVAGNKLKTVDSSQSAPAQP